MTSTTKLRVINGAGEPDDVLVLRIDVLQAAEQWYDAFQTTTGSPARDESLRDRAAARLELAITRYRAALKERATQ